MNEFEALVGCCLANTRVNMAYEREISRSKGNNIPEQGGSGGISPKLKDDILNLSRMGDVSAISLVTKSVRSRSAPGHSRKRPDTHVCKKTSTEEPFQMP